MGINLGGMKFTLKRNRKAREMSIWSRYSYRDIKRLQRECNLSDNKLEDVLILADDEYLNVPIQNVIDVLNGFNTK